MADDAVRVAQLGAGALGGMHLDAFYDDIADAELVAIYDPKFANPDARETAAAAYDGVALYPGAGEDGYDEETVLDALIDEQEPDAANIVTPHVFHYDQAKQFLEADVHVHVEKPVATAAADAAELAALADDRGLVLQPGYQRAVHPGYTAIADRIQDDMATVSDPYRDGAYREIGDLSTVDAYIKQDWWNAQHDTWRADGEFSGLTTDSGDGIGWGMAGDTGSHLLQTLLQMTRAEPVTVRTHIETRQGSGDTPVDVNSTWLIELEQANGNTVNASLVINGDGTGHRKEGMELYGPDGEVTYEETHDGDVLRYDGEPVDTAAATGYENLNRDKLAAFVDSVQDGGPAAVPARYGTQVTALHEAGYLSALRGEAVDVQALLDGD